MHDFLLAKEIVDEVLKIVAGKKLQNIKSVSLEIGSVSLPCDEAGHQHCFSSAHDGHAEHTEDISLENLEFGIENLVKNTLLDGAKFNIKKVAGESWKITDIEVE